MSKSVKEKITQLSPIEQIRHRPGMWLGGNEGETSFVCAREIYDNSLDALIRQYNQGRTPTYTPHLTITVSGSYPETVTIEDNCGGLPVTDPHSIETIYTPFSSSNYHVKGQHYTSGTNGVGSALVRAVSTQFDVTTWDGENAHCLSFTDSVPDNNGKHTTSKDTHKPGTKVSYTLDPQIIGKEETPLATILPARLELLPDLVNLCVGQETGLTITLKTDENTYTYQAQGLDKLTSSWKNTLTCSTQFTHTNGDKTTPVDILLTLGLTKAEEPTIIANTNTAPNPSGGVHVSGAWKALENAIAGELGKRGNTTLNKGEEPPQGKDVQVGVGMFVHVKMNEPPFAGQAKTALTNNQLKREITQALTTALSRQLTTPQGIAIIDKCVKNMRERTLKRTVKRKTSSTFSLSAPSKLADCKNHGENSELYIGEGLSACGALIGARDSYTQAVYALRGRPLTTYELSLAQCMKNEEISDIINILGAGIGKDFDISSMRYGKIIIASDADAAGNAITASMIATLYKLSDGKLISDGRVYILSPAFFTVTESKSGKRHYCEDETQRDATIAELKKKKIAYSVHRSKGLGSDTPDVTEETLMNPKTRRVEQVTISQAERFLKEAELWYKKNQADKRKDVISTTRASDVVGDDGADILRRNQLTFAHYSLSDQAIPQLDGLKPSARRLLLAMWEEKLTPKAKRIKSSKILGATTAKFHPFGDSGLYGVECALANVGQNVHQALVDFGGNYGHYVKEAASRYTEARLSEVGIHLVEDLQYGYDIVPCEMNYDDTLTEPQILPLRFPLLAMTGASGISVGFATNIPAYNPSEVMRLVEFMVTNPEPSLPQVKRFIKGPDFPSGGVAVVENLEDLLFKGEGKVVVRATIETQKASRGKHELIVSTLPPQVSVEQVIDTVKKKVQDGTLEGVTGITNLTDLKHGLRISIDTKQGVDPDDVISRLYAYTPLQRTFSANCNIVGLDGLPVKKGLVGLLNDFLYLRREVIAGISARQLDKTESRMHLVSGLLKVLGDVDKCVSIIRSSLSPDTARKNLKKEFQIDDTQANYVLSLRLSRLTRTEVKDLKEELATLKKTQRFHSRVLSDQDFADENVLLPGLKEIAEVVSSKRRTVIVPSFTTHTKPAPASTNTKEKKQGHAAFNSDGIASYTLSDLGKNTYTDDEALLLTSHSKGWKVKRATVAPRKHSPTPLVPLNNETTLELCVPYNPQSFVLLIDDKGKVHKFSCEDLPAQGVAGTGVSAHGKNFNPVFSLVATDKDTLYTATNASEKWTSVKDIPTKGRTSNGVCVHKFLKKDTRIITARLDKSHETTPRGASGDKLLK